MTDHLFSPTLIQQPIPVERIQLQCLTKNWPDENPGQPFGEGSIEATTGWRWVARELEARGFQVHLLDAGRASALRGRRRRAKTDKLDGDTLWFVPGSPTSAVSQESAQWCGRRPQKKRTGAYPASAGSY